MDKNYNIDIFHFDDYLNKQLMGISENQLLLLHVKLMVIFLFPLKGRLRLSRSLDNATLHLNLPK